MDRAAQLAAGFGGEAADADGDGPDDPDDVLRMICGVGGMKYREMDDNGEIVDDGEGEGEGGSASLETLLREVRGLREDHQSDALWTHARIHQLESAMRERGMSTRGPAMHLRRPAVQRTIRNCSTMQQAMLLWRARGFERKQMHVAWARLQYKGLSSGFNKWLAHAARGLFMRQVLARARQQAVVRALNTWRGTPQAARRAAERSPRTPIDAGALQVYVGSPSGALSSPGPSCSSDPFRSRPRIDL